MQSTVVHNSDQHRYEIWTDGELAGSTEYHPFRNALAFIHTEVDSKFEGHGLGSTLIQGALDEVRSRGEQVLPFCPFVRGYITKNPEYVDLVPADDRGAFNL
jgi:predicted GNAT family acetyltransferase